MKEIRLTAKQTSHEKAGALKSQLTKIKKTEPIHLWIEDVQPEDDSIASNFGFVPYRDLWQLTCKLPLADSSKTARKASAPKGSKLKIRAFEEKDALDFLRIQNRAFQWHPDEADMDAAELERRQAESWYDPQDFLLLEEDSKLIGFCWTKIHPPNEGLPAARNRAPKKSGARAKTQTKTQAQTQTGQQTKTGEIYMVGLDPSQHGRSLGGFLTLKGLEHLGKRGQNLGMLYVESDNYSANAVYKKLGMEHLSTNRAYFNQPKDGELPAGKQKRAMVQNMFNRIAKRYGLMNFILTFGLDRRWRKKALKELGLSSPPSNKVYVADLACGTADFCHEINHLQQKHALKNDGAPEIIPVGFDFAAGMLEVAKNRIKEAKPKFQSRRNAPETLFLTRADIASLPVENEAFSAAVMGFALRNLTDIPAVFNEISRILAPGSQFCILEVSVPKNRILRLFHSIYFKRIVPLLGKMLSDGRAYKYLPRSVAYLPNSKILAKMLESSGFIKIKIQPLTFGAVMLITAEKKVV